MRKPEVVEGFLSDKWVSKYKNDNLKIWLKSVLHLSFLTFFRFHRWGKVTVA